MLLWALSPGNCHWGTIGEESQSRVCGVVLIRWRVRLEADSGLLLEALQLIQPWVRQMSLRTLGMGWGLHPAGLQRLHQDRPLARPRAWGSGGTFPLSLSLRPTSSGQLSGSQSVRPGLPIWAAWGDWRPVRKDAWLSGMTAGQDVGTWPEGAANWDLSPLSQDWDLGG